MSPADSIQSPQPGPGQSPPEKPQSTSNDDGEHMVQTENKDSNRLLKSLLSQNDDEEVPTKEENSSSAQKMESTAEAQASVTKTPNSIEMEKNEAEAKKPSNTLLKVRNKSTVTKEIMQHYLSVWQLLAVLSFCSFVKKHFMFYTSLKYKQ